MLQNGTTTVQGVSRQVGTYLIARSNDSYRSGGEHTKLLIVF